MPYMMKIPGQSEEVHAAVQVLGNTLRVAILSHLAFGPATRATISGALGVTEQSLSRQMAFLEEKGVVSTEVLPGRGRPTLHHLQSARLSQLERALVAYLHPSP
ncbi:ArsR/SmtB family transcription factor [Kocuria sp. CPCC 204721]|uniref:ArsR/SmtB family transcription factor n=1 Tax=Kocuria sp. CPCC 204721 TaxID=3073548 RepID=UPI0034D68B91